MTHFRPLPRSFLVAATAPAVILILVVSVLPVAGFIVSSGSRVIPALRTVITSAVYRQVTIHTVALSAGSASLAVALGALYATTSYLNTGLARRMLLFLATLPLSASLLARLLAFTLLLQRYGVLNQILLRFHIRTTPAPLLYRSAAVIAGITYVFVPYAVFIIFGALQRIDTSLVRAASSAGASTFRRLSTLEWPLARPAVVIAAGLISVIAAGYFITPALLGGRQDQTLPMLVELNVNRLLDWPMAAALCVTLLSVVIVLTAAGVLATKLASRTW